MERGDSDCWSRNTRGGRAGFSRPHLVITSLRRIPLTRTLRNSTPLTFSRRSPIATPSKDGYTSEELKLCNETRKIMNLPDLRVTATCVRVPVMVGHGVAVHAEFSEPITPDRARSLLNKADGVEVQDDIDAGVYPTPLEAAGRNPCFVGRIRQDRFDDCALEMFCVADNLRKGAALNTVQIAELIAGEL